MNCGEAAQRIFGNNGDLKHWCFTVNPLIPLESIGLLPLTSVSKSHPHSLLVPMNHPGIFPSVVLWRGSSRSGTRYAGQLHLQNTYWERWFSSSEEKKKQPFVSIPMIETTRGCWIGIRYMCVYIYAHSLTFIFIYIYVQPIFYINTNPSHNFMYIYTQIKQKGHIKQKVKYICESWQKQK